jgi:hypothetical protein
MLKLHWVSPIKFFRINLDLSTQLLKLDPLVGQKRVRFCKSKAQYDELSDFIPERFNITICLQNMQAAPKQKYSNANNPIHEESL